MSTETVSISMTRFADFVATDPLGQLSKVREVRRQYEQQYRPGGDFWSRWREGIETVHRRGGGRSELDQIGGNAKDNRGEQYVSACQGYAKFWGRKHLEIASYPKPATWVHGGLHVRVNPEWVLTVNGQPVTIKLHLKDKLPLNQRLANPLLHLLDQHFGAAIGGPAVAILDVHRGKLWRPTTASTGLDAVLRMQAAAFMAGWIELDAEEGAA
jgi:hypothetical protein